MGNARVLVVRLARTGAVMSEDTSRGLLMLAAAYAAMVVICFGPATVQSERARDKHIAACRAMHEGDKDRQDWCPLGAPSTADGLPKALFWPLWLSYTAAAGG